MSHYSKIFNKVPVQVFNKSGFDLSHENLFTAHCGTIVPCMVDELLPNDTVTLGVSTQIQLPPMATDFYGRITGSFYAFFVPNRILYGGWQDLITHVNNDYPGGTSSYQKSRYLPYMDLPNNKAGAGSLADYLGMKGVSTTSGTTLISNPLPFFAYHKIYEDWFRDSRIQQDLYIRTWSHQSVRSMPWTEDYGDTPVKITELSYADNVGVYDLRQANWDKDYFVNATPKPQAGDPSVLAFSVDTQAGNGSFSIASLRAANSLQVWLERNNIAGYRYGDQIKAQFGVYPSDAITDRALYLGSWSTDVYTKSVYQTTPADDSLSRNPYSSVGAKSGSSQAVGNGSLIGKFTASEHGFLFVVFVLKPQAIYSTGSRRYFLRSSAGDFAFPLLANVGDQEIYNSELFHVNEPGSASGTFGYTQRYSEYKYMDDEVHGMLRDGRELEAFALQRGFASTPQLGTNFIQIPRNYLDQVLAVSDSNFGCWVDSYFSYKKSSVLPAYSIPTLGDLHNTHTEVIDNGGKRL